MDLKALEVARERAIAFLSSLPDRPVRPSATAEELRAALDGPLPETPSDPASVISDLADAADAGLLATPSPRFFGFVIGGGTPAAVAADWLTSAWDQNAGLYTVSPAAAVVEEIAARWLIELLGLPAGTSTGFVSGGTMANFTALATARTHVLATAGVDLERSGLRAAPAIRLVVGAERHPTIDMTLRYLGFGSDEIIAVESDEQGRMRPTALRAVLTDEPTIVCVQAGNINSGAFDPFDEIADVVDGRNVWVHVDGAIGLWAAAVPSMQHLVRGLARADSWSTDAHKLLNVPYDSGLVFTAHPDAHRRAMTTSASYLLTSGNRDPYDFVPELSRRARGFAVYAALRALGRAGVIEMVERMHACARRFAEKLGGQAGIEILNDVVLNQVFVSFRDAARTREIVAAIQNDGTAWMGPSSWRGGDGMRISVSNWQTTFEDVDASVAAILRACSAGA